MQFFREERWGEEMKWISISGTYLQNNIPVLAYICGASGLSGSSRMLSHYEDSVGQKSGM